MTAVDVAVGIIIEPVTQRVLVARRDGKDTHTGKWEFPGGKINPDESAGQALVRELREELGIEVLSFEPFESLNFDYSNSTVNLEFFMVADFAGQPRGLEGQTLSWHAPDELPQLDMLEANHLIIEKLLQSI